MAVLKYFIFITDLLLGNSSGISARLAAVSTILLNNIATPEKFVHAHQ